jgi:hypothetical protein
MTPAEELRAAAARLHEAAEKVDCGPPWAVAEDCPDGVVSGAKAPYGAPWVASAIGTGNAVWIALASPALAGPLAAWLEAEAHLAERDELRTTTPIALVAARVINGGEPS